MIDFKSEMEELEEQFENDIEADIGKLLSESEEAILSSGDKTHQQKQRQKKVGQG